MTPDNPVSTERLVELIEREEEFIRNWHGRALIASPEGSERAKQEYRDRASALRELQSARLKLAEVERALQPVRDGTQPIPMILFCPLCSFSHIDEGVWATTRHKTHLCANCGFKWRPCNQPTVGVASIDNFGPVDTALSASKGTPEAKENAGAKPA